MANQNDKRNQQTDSKSNPQTQEGYKKTTDSNNPADSQGTQPGQQQGKQQPGSQQGKTNPNVPDTQEREDEFNDETTIQRRPGESEADYQKRKNNPAGQGAKQGQQQGKQQQGSSEEREDESTIQRRTGESEADYQKRKKAYQG